MKRTRKTLMERKLWRRKARHVPVWPPRRAAWQAWHEGGWFTEWERLARCEDRKP